MHSITSVLSAITLVNLLSEGPDPHQEEASSADLRSVTTLSGITPQQSNTFTFSSPSTLSARTRQTTDRPWQPRNFNFPKKAFGKQNRSFQPNWFSDYPWLHYSEESDSVTCFICSKQNAAGTLISASKKEMTFISHGFSNWKKALTRFKEHQTSECHKLAVDFEVNIPQTHPNFCEVSNEQAKCVMQKNRKCLIKIIECLQYLCRQGQAIQGDSDEESNLIQLLKLRSKDDGDLQSFLEKGKREKYVSHDIQNELISIMANHVLKKIVEDIGSSFFSIIADEYTDINNKEQLTICVRWVDNELQEHEDFLGFYEVPDIESDTIVSAIKDAFLRLQLSLSCCRGQCYDGASNMLGRKSGVAKQIQDVEPKAHATHCHAHSLSLSVKDTTSNCKVLSDSMNNTKEIVKLVKRSPKRDKILGEITENIEKEGASEAAGLIKLSVTRWTIRAACFQRVIDNYEALLSLWEECLSSKLEAELRGRILGCQAQMKSFDYFFGLSLGQRIYAHTDNLSKTLQNEKLSAVSGQRNAELTKRALQSIRTDQCFQAFYESVIRKKERFPAVSEPVLPRKRRVPVRFEIGTASGNFPETVQDHYRRIYFEALDLIVEAINERFDQPSFVSSKNLESLLVNFVNASDVSSQMKYVEENYAEDIKITLLLPQLEIFKVLVNDVKIDCFHDIWLFLKQIPVAQRLLISEIVQICKLFECQPCYKCNWRAIILFSKASKNLASFKDVSKKVQQFSNSS